MASVQELIAASEQNKSPFIKLLEGATQGFGNAQQGALDRNIKLMQMDQMRQEAEQQAEMRKQIQGQIAGQQEANTKQSFNGIAKPATRPLPTQKLEWEISQDEKGKYSRKLKTNTPKDVSYQQAKYVDKTGQNRIGRFNPQTGQVDMGPNDPMAPAEPGVSGAGKMMPPATVLTLNQGKTVARMLPEVEKAIEANLGKFGPFTGRTGQANPYNIEAQTFDAQMRTSSQMYGRFMEDGVLRKEDEEKYRKMFPQSTDPDKLKKNKLAIAKKLLFEKYEDDRSTLGKSGYDVSGFEILEAPGSVFDKDKPKEKTTVEEVSNIQKRLQDRNVKQVNTQEEYDALPSGSEYTDSEGNKARKR